MDVFKSSCSCESATGPPTRRWTGCGQVVTLPLAPASRSRVEALLPVCLSQVLFHGNATRVRCSSQPSLALTSPKCVTLCYTHLACAAGSQSCCQCVSRSGTPYYTARPENCPLTLHTPTLLRTWVVQLGPGPAASVSRSGTRRCPAPRRCTQLLRPWKPGGSRTAQGPSRAEPSGQTARLACRCEGTEALAAQSEPA